MQSEVLLVDYSRAIDSQVDSRRTLTFSTNDRQNLISVPMVKVSKVSQGDAASSASRTDYLAVSGYLRSAGFRRKRLIYAALKKMLAPTRRCASGSSGVSSEMYDMEDRSGEFLSTGRTGRRNALPDILGRHAQTGLLDLTDRFKDLSTETDQAGPSGEDPNVPGTSKQHG